MDGKEGMLLFRDKQAKLLLMLADGSKEWYLSTLAKSAEVTYIHTSRFIRRCESMGITGSEKHGKIKRIFLTERGRSIADGIQGIMNQMNGSQASPQQPPAEQK